MARKLMNAVQYDSYGGGVAGLKHVEIPVPAPKKDEILLKLEAASLNPVDWKIQEGLMPPNLIPRKLPFIPASDIAGEVVEVGTGVTKFKAGDKVVSYLGFPEGSLTARDSVVGLLLRQHDQRSWRSSSTV